MAVLIFDEFERPSIGVKGADRIIAVGKNQGVVEHGRRRFRLTSTSMASPADGCTGPSEVDRSAAPHLPWSADRRVRGVTDRRPRPPRGSPLAIPDAAITRSRKQRQRRRQHHFGCDVGSEPSASAPASHAYRVQRPRLRRVPPTFIRPDTIRFRIAGVCTRDSSKRNALMMCCFSTLVWLFQNKVACV